MYMLDTDTCSYIIKMRPTSILQQLKHLAFTDLCISAITQAELLYGAARTSAPKHMDTIVKEFISRLIVYAWDGSAAEQYSILRAYLEKKGTLIGNMDIMIAAHALSLHAHIVTNNTKHFRKVPHLKVVNWLE